MNHSLGRQGTAEADIVVRISGRIIPIRRPTTDIATIIPIAPGNQTARSKKPNSSLLTDLRVLS